MSANNLNTARVRQAADFAQEYDALMGLSMVPLGAGFLLAAVTRNPGFWIALGSLLAFGVIAWYNRKYGAVRPKSGRTAVMAVGVVIASALIGVAAILDKYLEPPVSLSLLAMSLTLGIGSWLMSRRIGQTPAHWIAFGLLFVMAFGPAVGIGSTGLFAPYLMVPLGSVFIILGLIDHARFVRLIGPLPDESE